MGTGDARRTEAASHTRRRIRPAVVLLLLLLTLSLGPFAVTAGAEQASAPPSPAAAQLDAGRHHICAVLPDGAVRCWGYNAEGELGYGNTKTIGDNETPAAAGPVDLGDSGAVAIAAGDYHTCALMEDEAVRCWGFGGDGRLGYGNASDIGNDEPAASAGRVNLGAGHTAKAIAAGGAHTCAILDDASVRCWGHAFYGQLGYGNPDPAPGSVDELDPVNVTAPGSAGPVPLGGHTAKAITAGDFHTCAILDDDTVRCWGRGRDGQLGYGSTANVGDRDSPVSGTVDLGSGHTAKAISSGGAETCALLDDDTVRCWGYGGNGRLGYANLGSIGDNEAPGSVGPVDLGAQRTALAVSVGDGHACALLDDSAVRCWGFNGDGRLGYADTTTIGDNEVPAGAGPVSLGAQRTARALSLGARHTCALLDDGNVRCWGYGGNGRLGYCDERNVGDDETPGSVGPVDLGVPASGAPGCPPASPGSPPAARTAQTTYPLYPAEGEAVRRAAYKACLSKAARHVRREVRRARRLSGRRRARLRRHIKRHRARLKRACVRRHGRTPGRVTGLAARALSRRRIRLTFTAPGTDGSNPPAARTYVIKQSRRPIRGARGFRRAQTLCARGRCRFAGVTDVGTKLTLTVTDLRRRTTYYYAVAARDNVTGKLGPRSRPAKVKTR